MHEISTGGREENGESRLPKPYSIRKTSRENRHRPEADDTAHATGARGHGPQVATARWRTQPEAAQ